MKMISWNVNSIKIRLPRFLALLERHEPDVVCLQELKVVDDKFPHEAIEAAGYQAATFGQKTYNGVALVSRHPIANVRRGLGGGHDDPAARAIFGEIDGVTVGSLYVPNGQSVGSDKFAYKLDWYAHLLKTLEESFDPDRPLVLAGDYNVARDDLDVRNVDKWAPSVLCAPEVRDAMDRLLDWGLVDVFREKHPEGGIYSWWDYRMLGFPKNDGLRIDYLLATAPLAEQCDEMLVDRDERKGKQPSDHAPVIGTFPRG